MDPVIPQPNYTQIPNSLLDNIDKFTPAEWKLVCAVARQTFGWHKRMDRMSISQMVEKTGLSKQGVVNSVHSLLQSGILTRVADGDGYLYGLNIAPETDDENIRSSQLSRQGVVNSVDRGSQLSRQGVVNSVDTQKKDKKIKKEIDNSSSSSGDVDPAYAEIATMAMQSGIYLGQIQAEMLQEMIEEYGPVSVKNALAIAAGAGKLNLRYVNGICRRQRNGDEPPRRKGDAVNGSNGRNNEQEFIGGLPVYQVELPEPTGEVDF